jgi:ClpP class serine protease
MTNIESLKIKDLIPYAKNSRTHSAEQVSQIADSIKEFGWTNPVLVSESGTIIAGHGRVLAARKLGIDEIPCIRLKNLTETQIQAYVIADNKLALNAGWDEETLKAELMALENNGYELELTGFSTEELEELFNGTHQENAYTSKIKGLVYEITGEKPALNEMVDSAKSKELVCKIQLAKISDEAKELLLTAAQRHVVFNYGNIAEYYAHSPKEVQKLMEESALVIVDMDSAIENGYVEMTKTIEEIQKRAQNG